MTRLIDSVGDFALDFDSDWPRRATKRARMALPTRWLNRRGLETPKRKQTRQNQGEPAGKRCSKHKTDDLGQNFEKRYTIYRIIKIYSKFYNIVILMSKLQNIDVCYKIIKKVIFIEFIGSRSILVTFNFFHIANVGTYRGGISRISGDDNAV